MPKATTDPTATTTHQLVSLPEGYVTLRQMTYGEFLRRQDMAMKVDTDMRNKMTSATIAMMQEAVTQYEFQCCIVDHNLEDQNNRKLSFSNVADFKMLDPRVGQEIGRLIDLQNKWEQDQEAFKSSDQEGNTHEATSGGPQGS